MASYDALRNLLRLTDAAPSPAGILPEDVLDCRAHYQSMKFPVTIERDETGMIVTECPAIPGCVSQGRTEEEALKNIHDAIVACLEVRAEQGLPLTVRTVQVDVDVA